VRLVEKCSCAASIELIWNEPTYSHSRELAESKRATAELSAFRKAHQVCRDRARAEDLAERTIGAESSVSS
jgi:hypothetical protein